MFEEAKKQLGAARRYAKINEESWEILQFPKRVIQASIPMRHDDGTLKVYKAFRVQYNDLRGPCKGGIRFHPNAGRDHCEALAFWMTFKTAVASLPLGGGKGSVLVDSKSLSNRELERLSKAYIDSFADFIGPDTDIPAPDMYTDERVMGWMYSEYRKIKGGHPKDIITGKPAALGGIEGRNTATGYGGYFVLNTLLNEPGLKFNLHSPPTVALQGFGKVGYWFAEILHKKGFQIVAISNEYGGIYNRRGINPVHLRTILDSSKYSDWGEGDKISNEDLLSLPVDILCPAAIEKVITAANADKVKAKVVLELANGPIDNTGDAILNDKGIFVIPDILANAGGVVVSYFEWVQNRNGVVKTVEEVNRDLEAIMTYATRRTTENHLKHKVPMRTAAYILALKRIADANECLGNKGYFTGR